MLFNILTKGARDRFVFISMSRGRYYKRRLSQKNTPSFGSGKFGNLGFDLLSDTYSGNPLNKVWKMNFDLFIRLFQYLFQVTYKNQDFFKVSGKGHSQITLYAIGLFRCSVKSISNFTKVPRYLTKSLPKHEHKWHSTLSDL